MKSGAGMFAQKIILSCFPITQTARNETRISQEMNILPYMRRLSTSGYYPVVFYQWHDLQL